MKQIAILGLTTLMLGASSLSYSQQAEQQMDALLQKEYAANEPGAAVLVAKAGKPLYRKGFGMGNLEHDLPISPDMVFEIGSISKQFTAVGILMLAEEGKLSLEDELTKYLPDFPVNGQRITLHQMLTHTSGLNNYTDMPEWRATWRKDYAPLEFIESFKSHPMVGAPGERFAYSNTAYFMLGYVIEKASGMSYAQFLEERIFKPAGMANSYYGSWSRIVKKRAAGYQRGEEGFVNAEYLSFSHPYAAGSIMSTVDDLMKWNEALHANKLLKPEMLQKAFTDYTTSNGKKIGYGYGWSIMNVADYPSIEHGGGIFGFVTYSLYVPSEKLFVSVLTNRDDKNPEDVAARLAAIALNKPYLEAGANVQIPEERLKQYAGAYEFEDGAVRFITFEGGSLYSQRESGGKFKIFPISENAFAYEGSLTTIQFENGGALFNTRSGTSKGVKTDRQLPSEIQEIKLETAVLEQYVGVYELQPGFDLAVSLADGQLMAQATGQPQFPIFAETEELFFLKVVPAKIKFVKDEGGKVASLILYQGGREMPAKRK